MLQNRFMKRILWLWLLSGCLLLSHCRPPATTTRYDKNVIESVLLSTDSLRTFPFLNERVQTIQAALQQVQPILLDESLLDERQQVAQILAVQDPFFAQFYRDAQSKNPLRNEIFGVHPARDSDLFGLPNTILTANCYRVELYNFAHNVTAVAIVDVENKQLVAKNIYPHTQPDLPAHLVQLATKIAVQSPEVQAALGYTPAQSDALMADTKTALNRTRCERSRHLCVAPTFVKGNKALWAIVDLTDHRLVGIRWTNVGTTRPAAPITERRLQDDKITACFCDQEQPLKQNDWQLRYQLTSSDGLRISDVTFKEKPVLQSAKLVDWHVSYSGTDGFGYSDAVGCPYFSQSAVIALDVPQVGKLYENGQEVGFVLEQTFRSDGWPTPCNYNYKQRYEFYNDGRFRVACASLGRGCGDNGTYRPVFRIVFAANNPTFAEWTGNSWLNWKTEAWQLQQPTTNYTTEGYQYRLTDKNQSGYYLMPSNGQFADGGRGDQAYVYVTRIHADKDEGEADLVTIGPCCNEDYRQGPERFIEPTPEPLADAPQVAVWYVAQLKNDDTPGRQYCWAESEVKDGIFSTEVFPCFCGPLFVPTSPL